jgi:hypothetical protein
MSAQLLIRDGNPYWYMSPDIWGTRVRSGWPPGSPIEGFSAYLWCRVANTGDTFARNVAVDFYW